MRTGLRLAVTACIGSLAVSASVALVRSELPRAEAADLPQFDPLFPPYQQALIFPMGEALRVEGVPLRLGYFTAAATPQQVVDFYSAVWRRQSLTVTGEQAASGAHASAFDGVTGVVHSISALAQGKRVLAFCSVTTLRAPAAADPREELIPVPPGARFVEHTSSGAGPGGQLSVTYLADGTRGEHEAELQRLLESQGWKALAARTRRSATGETLEFQKGNRLLLAALFDDPGTQTVGVQLHASRAIEGDGAAP